MTNVMPSSTPSAQLPRLVVLTTGGTIVSSGDSATQMTGYSIRGVTVDKLLKGVPELDQLATLTVEPDFERLDGLGAPCAAFCRSR